MELSYKLQTLQPLRGALDILRMLGAAPPYMADSYEIMEKLELTERTFSKAIRRLATNDYVQMDGDQVYRLTDKGKEAAEELAAYDAATPADQKGQTKETPILKRRMVLAVPPALVAGKPTNVVVGFSPASNGQLLPAPADMVVRLSVLNGEPSTPEDLIFALYNSHTQDTVRVTAGYYTQIRLKMEVFQLGPNPDDISISGGMYVDVDVVADTAPSTSTMVAYGVDVDVAVHN